MAKYRLNHQEGKRCAQGSSGGRHRRRPTQGHQRAKPQHPDQADGHPIARVRHPFQAYPLLIVPLIVDLVLQ